MASQIWNDIFNKNMNNIPKNIHNNYELKLDSVYGINNRIDYTNLIIYSIDPENCTDADDAFSVYKENNLIHLFIHIADPTAYFNPIDPLFDDIIKNGTTVYLSNNEPDHLFPKNILEECSLINGIKNVLIVHTIINNLNIISSKVEYGIINCSNGKRFSYESSVLNLDDVLLLSLEVSEYLKSKRNCSAINDLSLVIPIVKDSEVILKPDIKEVKMMKNMIAEFAIHANTIFAQELDINNLFLRKLELHDKDYDNIHDLIENKICASYTNKNIKHDLIGTNSCYTHSTSPLRRTSDCIVHFLLKSKFLLLESPFTHEQLETFADILNKKNKEMKQLQFKDSKLRTFQWIAEELESRLNPIKIKVKLMKSKGFFINLMIIKIDNMDVNISYTLKMNNKRKNKLKELNEINSIIINITKINPFINYDEGTLPELDAIFE
uniref:RNB domain-containing protein n=1 Tax=viral metagenome TaxID=1070528 RepID=A0A6C0HW07_9ZZZZ